MDEPTSTLRETPSFRTKSSWNPPKGPPNLDVYLNQVESSEKEIC